MVRDLNGLMSSQLAGLPPEAVQAEAAQEEQMEFMNPMLMGPMWVY